MADHDIEEAKLSRVVADAALKVDEAKANYRVVLNALRKYRREKANQSEKT